jgi:hypothetical protein
MDNWWRKSPFEDLGTDGRKLNWIIQKKGGNM